MPRIKRDHAMLIEYKTDEWARFCGADAEWEREMYSEFLP
jgi:hypothetical protein